MDINHSYKPNTFFALMGGDNGCFFQQVDDQRLANVDGARLNGRSIEVLGHSVDCKSLSDSMNALTRDEGFGYSITIPEDSGHRIQKNFYRLLLGAWELPEDQLLFRALEMERIDIALGLVRAGCHLNGTDTDGNTVLHRAVRAGSPELIQALVQAGANLGQKNESQWIPIDLAVFYGNEQIVRAMTQGGHLSEIREEDLSLHLPRWFQWMLHSDERAEAWEDLEEKAVRVFKSIIDSIGAEVLRANPDLLHKVAEDAIDHYVPEVAEHLMKIGLVFDYKRKGEGGQTLLHLLVERYNHSRKCSYGMVEVFLRQGALVDAQDEDLQTPLHFAVTCEGSELTKLLIANGANVQLADSNGKTPIQKAVEKKNFSAAVALANHRAVPDDLTPEDCTEILYQAIKEGERPLVEILCQSPTFPRDNLLVLKDMLERAFKGGAQNVAAFFAHEFMALDPTPGDVEEMREMAAIKKWNFVYELLGASIKG